MGCCNLTYTQTRFIYLWNVIAEFLSSNVSLVYLYKSWWVANAVSSVSRLFTLIQQFFKRFSKREIICASYCECSYLLICIIGFLVCSTAAFRWQYPPRKGRASSQLGYKSDDRCQFACGWKWQTETTNLVNSLTLELSLLGSCTVWDGV